MGAAHGAQDFMYQHSPCETSSPNLAALGPANRHIITDDDDLDPGSGYGTCLLSSYVEMKYIPSVVLDDEDGTALPPTRTMVPTIWETFGEANTEPETAAVSIPSPT